MSRKTKKVILLILLIATTLLMAYWLHNSVVTYTNPGARFGHVVDPAPSLALANVSKGLTFTVFLSLVAAIKSLRLGFLLLGAHFVYLIISGFVVLWL